MIADFPLQTAPVFHWKTRSIRGVAAHAFIHLGVSMILFAPALLHVWPALLVLFIIHTLQDQSKVSLGGEKVNTPFPFLLDQGLHLITLAAASLLPPLRDVHSLPIPAHWAFFLAGATAATFAGTIFLYTLAQSLPGERHDLGITLSRKSVDFLFNGLMYGGILASWYWLTLLALACKGIVWKSRVGGPYYSALLELAVSPLWVVVMGMLTQQTRTL